VKLGSLPWLPKVETPQSFFTIYRQTKASVGTPRPKDPGPNGLTELRQLLLEEGEFASSGENSKYVVPRDAS